MTEEEELKQRIEELKRERDELAERMRYHEKARDHFDEMEEVHLKRYADDKAGGAKQGLHHYEDKIVELELELGGDRRDGEPRIPAPLPSETAEGQHSERLRNAER